MRRPPLGDAYDSRLWPILFAPFAGRLAEVLPNTGNMRLLEVAAGSGCFTELLADRRAADDKIVASDLNRDSIVSAGAAGLSAPLIQQCVADATCLPFGSGIFDIVVSHFGVPFFRSPTTGHRQVHRVLKERGTYAFSTWLPVESNSWARILHQVVRDALSGGPPMKLDEPFLYGNIHQIRADLVDCGFVEVRLELLEHTLELPAGEFADIVITASPLRFALERRSIPLRELVRQTAEAYEMAGETWQVLRALIVSAKRGQNSY